MQLHSTRQRQTVFSFSFSLKCGAIALLFLLCALIAACSSDGSDSQSNPSNPLITGTIDLNGANSSPTPPMPPYLCGAWVTNNSPAFSPHRPISIFAKFVQTNTPQDPGNPVGVDGATGTATIQWPDGSTETVTAKTTSDGLAVFPITIKPDAANKIVLIEVTFTKDGFDPCTVPQPAYFTPILVSPTPTPTPADIIPTDTPTPTSTPYFFHR
jgi:hypothetical protein